MNHVRKSLTALALLASAWPLMAQTANTPSAQPAPAASRLNDANTAKSLEEVVELTPFEVSATRDDGYQATETLAGTRIRTDLKDVGGALTVITKEFMKDIGATDNATLLQYTPNAEVAGTRGTYAGVGNGTSVDETSNLRAPGGAQRVRGLASADNTRDFFVTDIPWDGFNVDRIDIQRGPNSILFGLGSPAGIVNASTRNAEFRNLGSVEARYGSYGSFRSTVDVNQVIIPKVLALRLDGLWNDEKFQQNGAFQEDKRYYGTIRFEPQLFKRRDFRTSIKAKYEHGEVEANRPRILPPQDSITPWFRAVNTASLDGGMGKLSVNSAYEIGSAPQNTSGWLAGDSIANQQQPIWFQDGTTGQLMRIYGGFINTGSLSAAGVKQGASASIVGQRYATMFYGLGGMAGYAVNAQLPGYQYGQYRNASLTDSSVFDFYNNLIDGPNKSEFEKWDAYNVSLTQTGWNDRVGVELNFDRQKYKRGGEALLGNPAITLDVLRNFQDLTANPNYGRPYVVGGPGRGNSYESDRKYLRGSLFGEVRATDFLDKDSFLAKLLGKHRFNGVYSNEKYSTENRSWQMYANDEAWSRYKLQGATDGINNLAPITVIYLGSSLANASTAAGANIAGIAQPITIRSGNIYAFDSTWLNPTGVNFSDVWNVPTNLQPMFNATTLTQVSNPANYIGWNTRLTVNPMSYRNGEDLSLLTAAAKTMRETTSYAGSWQGFLWKDAIVPTLGWRYDEVKGKGISAPVTSYRGTYNLDQNVYKLPDVYPANQIFKDHSASGGVVVHLNKLFGERDPLPLNVSLSYNKSSNFQVTDTRRDIYGNVIANPTGSTKDYGVLISTKNGKYSFRAVKYETRLTGSNTQLDNSGIYGTIRDAMNWRNIKLYYMSIYDWASAGQTDTRHFAGLRYMWDPAWVNITTGRPVASGQVATGPANSRLETQAEADIRRDAALKGLNELQSWLTNRGYFTGWNYGVGPTTLSALQTRGEYEASPKTPVTASVYDYRTAPLMQGFAVTADTQSKGYEFELTANPTRNWRVAFNASKTTAVRTNVGGASLEELVGYMDTLMAGPSGDLVRFNSDYSAGNELRFVWNSWRGQYTLMKLQEGAAASELRKWRYNVVTNYSFREGTLKGFGVGGSYRWQDKVVIGYPVVAGTGGQASFDLTKPYYGPSEDAFDAWINYERKLTKKINWKIQLNGRNLFGKEELIPISVQPDGQTWASARIAPNREWYVTNTFSF